MENPNDVLKLGVELADLQLLVVISRLIPS